MLLKRFGFFSFMLGAVTLYGVMPAAAAEMIYFHSEACPVCERWNEEVGTIYPKTEESKRLPLRKQSVHDTVAADLAFVNAVGFTPTFVVVEDGKEIGRITGYVNDMFFWQHVEEMLAKMDATASAKPAAEVSAKVPSCAHDATGRTC